MRGLSARVTLACIISSRNVVKHGNLAEILLPVCCVLPSPAQSSPVQQPGRMSVAGRHVGLHYYVAWAYICSRVARWHALLQ